MGILRWDRPARAIPHEEWLRISADGAPPGVYTPNMSEADALAWKAKMAGQRTPGELRVEIRKAVSSPGTGRTHRENKGHRWPSYAQVVILVYADGEVRMSANGQMAFSPREWGELSQAVSEAREELSRQQARQEKEKRRKDHHANES